MRLGGLLHEEVVELWRTFNEECFNEGCWQEAVGENAGTGIYYDADFGWMHSDGYVVTRMLDYFVRRIGASQVVGFHPHPGPTPG